MRQKQFLRATPLRFSLRPSYFRPQEGACPPPQQPVPPRLQLHLAAGRCTSHTCILEAMSWQLEHLQDVVTGTPNSPRFIFVKRARVDVPKQLPSHQQVRHKDHNAYKIPRELLEEWPSEKKQLRFIRRWKSVLWPWLGGLPGPRFKVGR